MKQFALMEMGKTELKSTLTPLKKGIFDVEGGMFDGNIFG